MFKWILEKKILGRFLMGVTGKKTEWQFVEMNEDKKFNIN